MKNIRTFLTFLVFVPIYSFSQINVFDSAKNINKYFSISGKHRTTSIVFDSSENILIKKSADFLSADIEKVTGKKTAVINDLNQVNNLIIVGTAGNSKLINQLVAAGKLDVKPITGQWERFIIKTIDKPFKGVNKALVIVGSDRRGAAYGVFTLSEKMGVSPWYWWADAPVKKMNEIYLENCNFISKGPAVKYRGIFINDESPAFRYWAKEKFGGTNHKCYETIFELLLRNKANFLWPSMWLPTMFNVDDPLNPKVADEFGIVMSTSHHEPMMRAHNEWSMFKGGVWDYNKNKEKLREFWRGGIERMGKYESVVTVGMRGDGDEGMAEETAVDLLQTIIKDQRGIIEKVTKKPANETPQVWAIYKEVQDYYDKGMQVDDDITILFSDDNWGNIRYLPKKEALGRKGGYGMYYHFDYVGAPVSYRWLNVTQIERVWYQMKLTFDHGVKNLWIANVGDIKPMELPISFFLDYAWDPEAIQVDDLPKYYVRWADQQFGGFRSEDIAVLLSLYTKYNARRIHEMIKPDTYSLENYREADRVVDEFKQLLSLSTEIYQQIPVNSKSSFYQLVHSPIALSCNLLEMYVAAGKNKLYAAQGRSSANYYAEKVKELFLNDIKLTNEFHTELENGKWNHMMSQTHMGYTSWNHPRSNVMPAVSYMQTRTVPCLGFEIEYGPEPQWNGFSVEADPLFSNSFTNFDPVNQQSYYIDIFNMGEGILDYSIEAKDDWIILSKKEGSIKYDEKVYVSIDWKKAPEGRNNGSILIKGAGKVYSVRVPIQNEKPLMSGFIENNGVVSIEASNFTNKIDTKSHQWTVVPNLGRTHSSLIVLPVNIQSSKPLNLQPCVEYEFSTFNSGNYTVETYLSPTQDFRKQGGLKFAVSINDEEPQIINSNEGETEPDYKYAAWWTKSVGDKIKIKVSRHKIQKPGKQTLKIWMIDTGLVFQKFVISTGRSRSSYLGAPESKFIKSSQIK